MRRTGWIDGNTFLSIVLTGVLLAGFCCVSPVEAQSGSQNNQVNIPLIQIVSAPSDVTITNYQSVNGAKNLTVTNANTWTLISNSLGGASVEFTASDFVNQSDSNFKRSIKLEVNGGTSDWSNVSSNSDTSDGSTASVSVDSTGDFPSFGTVNLTTSFVHKNKDLGPNGNTYYAPEGNYTTTVTATLSEQ